MQMTNTRHNSFSKKALSVVLTLMMAFGYVGVLSGVIGADLFGTKQTAEAMTSQSQGTYYISVDGICVNDAYANGMDVIVYYKPNNGRGTETHKSIYSRSDNYTWDGTGNDDRWDYAIDGFPTKVEYQVKKRYSVGKLEMYANIYVAPDNTGNNRTFIGSTNQNDWTSSGWHTVTWTADSSVYPSPTVTHSGPTAVFTSGSATATYEVATAKDQYGVNWEFSSVTWTSSNTNYATINNSGVATFKNNSGTNYNVTFTPTLVHTSGNKTVSGITAYAYTTKAITYNLNGGTVSGTNPTSYNLNTAAVTLINPTKPGYTFAGWTGANGSVPQTSVQASNGLPNGLTFSTGSPYTASGRDHILGNEFPVTPGVVYRVYVTAKRTAGSLDLQGGIWYSTETSGYPYDGYGGAFTYMGDAGSGWGVYYKDITVPSGKQGGQFYIQLDQSSPNFTTTWLLANCRVFAANVTGVNFAAISYTANWTPNDYTATFKADDTPDPTLTLHDSAKDSTATFNTDGSITFPTGADFSKDYYTFDGKWKIYSIGSGETNWSASDTTLYNAGQTYTLGKYGDVTFRAQYTPVDYQIEFDPNGGAAVTSNWTTPYSNRYKYNYENRAKSDYTLQTTLPATTWLGYTLVGWQPTANVGNWDSTHVYPAGTSFAGMHGDSTLDTVVLKAVWESVTATVTLDLSEGGSINGNTSLAYAFNSSLALNNPTRTGYTFKGWKVTVPPSYGDDYTTYPTANRWVMDTEYLLGQETQVTLPSGKLGDVTLTPIWEANEYTVTFFVGGETPIPATVSPASKTFTIEDSFNLSTPSRVAYTFNNWSVNQHDATYNWTASTYNGGQSVSGMYGNATLTANWTPITYTATLNVNGGDALASATRTFDYEHSAELPTPTRTGFVFDYWEVVSYDTVSRWQNDSEHAESTFNGSLPVGYYGNVTLKAHWTHTKYTMTLSGGSAAGNRDYYIDSPAFTLGASTLAGYNFVNWTVDANAGNWVKDAAYNADTSISGKWGDVNLTAHFTPITYTITYKDKDGETQYTDTYTIEDAVEIDDYAVPGYTFGGWIVSGFDETTGGGWHNGDDISAGTLSANMYYGDITLSPILTAKSYTVTYDFNGAPATCGNLPYTIESTDELPGNDSANPPTKTGHNFSGWKVVEVGDEGNWTLNAIVPGNTALTGKYGSVKLQAQWTPKNYTITYITGTYPDGITKQGTYGQPAPDLTDAEKAKPADAQYTYTFKEWDPSLTTVTGEKTYTAVYANTLNKYDITWMIPDDVNGTLTNYAATVTPNVDYGTVPVYNNGVNPELASDIPTEYEWRFAGWSLTAGGAKLESIPAVSGPATYYALFTKVLAPEQVIWNIEGVTNTELWGIGETPEWRHDTPTKADANGYKYTFTHWDPTPVAVVQHGGPYTYYAQFSASLQDYTITLKLNGGAMSDPLTMDYQMGDTLTFPTPEKTGYTFAGWLLDEAVGSWAADTTVPAGSFATGTKWGNVSFTAQWTPVEYTITFAAASEDDVLPANKTYTIESTDAIPAATREGHTLSGWLISVGGGNWTQGATVAAAYSLLENYGNVTLTPMWQVNTYTLTWISGDYTETSEAEYGSAILAYAPLTRQGYSAAWDQEVPAAMPAQNLTFRAVYTATDYYVRLYVNGGSALDNFYYTIEGCSENQTPTFDTLPTPTREGATFTGWKVTQAQGNWIRNAIVNGGASLIGKFGNVTLTAQWELETHTVTWVAGDVTKEAVWLYGATPSYDGTPYKSPDETNSYVFREWDKEIVPVTEDVTYTALFDSIERTYTVIWNIDGATTTQYYHYGDTPTYPGATDPVRPSTYEYDFTFSGWSPAVADVTKDVTYTAQFDVFTKLQGLSIDVSSLFLAIGANDTVTAQIYPATATVRDVVWTSKNTDVATIDSAGTVTAVSPGVALINVSSVDKSFNAYCVVTVAPTHTSYVAISAGGVSTTQLPGSLLQLTATLQPENATDTGITWSSGDLSVATVDNTGLVRFVGVGETDITAMASDGFSLGSIHVVTTSDESEVEDNVKTYRITFGSFNGGFKFAEDGEVYTEGFCNVPEGETLRFKLNVEDADQGKYSVYVNGRKLSYGSDYWYALENVDANAVISIRDSAAGVGIPEQQEDNSGLTFFQKLAAFLRKIVEFFRGIFNK